MEVESQPKNRKKETMFISLIENNYLKILFKCVCAYTQAHMCHHMSMEVRATLWSQFSLITL